MAKGGRKKRDHSNAPQNTTQKLTRDDVRQGMAEIDRLRSHAARYTGELGAFKKGFCERTRLSVQAVAIVGKLDRLGDDLKRQSVMDEVLLMFKLMGWDDQGTLFGRGEAAMANRVAKTEDDEDDPRPAFLKNAVPLPDAEKAFDAANEVAEAKASLAKKRAAKQLPDALASLASGKTPAPEEPKPH